MEDKNTELQLEGYNPKVYKQLSFVFVILTILNVAAIMLSFMKIGYGLYHAESALSHIAQIDSNIKQINTDILDMSFHSDEKGYISECIDSIKTSYEKININSDKFREINLDNIDSSLSGDFDDAIFRISNYYDNVSEQLEAVKNGSESPSVLYSSNNMKQQLEATTAIENLFDKQDKATYSFFVKTAQSFLLVVLFLIFTMGLGLFAISRVKKKDMAVALRLQESKDKATDIRRKAMDLAYMNIVSGLKNRYALDEELDKKIKNDDFSIALYNFNKFNTLNEQYGRRFADEFVAAVSKIVKDRFSNIAEIYSTEIDEFCVVFNKELPKRRIDECALNILYTLSQKVQVQNIQVKMNVAGCIYHYSAGEHSSSNSLFIALDKGVNAAKQMCYTQNQSLLIPINK